MDAVLKGSTTREKYAEEVVYIIADRLRDPVKIKSVVLQKSNVSSIGKVHPWDDLSLSHGFPATVLLYAELDRIEPDAGWDQIAHQHMIYIQHALENKGFSDLSLFTGLTGVAFAAWSASHGGKRYIRFLNEINKYIAKELDQQLFYRRRRREESYGTSATWYDVISGITGIGRYLLIQRENPQLGDLLIKVLKELIFITRPIQINGVEVPGWYLPQEVQFLEKDKKAYPNGNFNIGLAHGISGPLALLSLSKINGVEVDGQKEAIQVIVDWLLKWKQQDDQGFFWFDRVSWEEEVDKQSIPHRRREAWCYGTPGVARAIYLAGKALGNVTLKKIALESYRAVFRRSEATWNIDAPTFCHGTAGMLEMARQMDLDEKESGLKRHLDYLFYRQLRDFNPEFPFGYRDLEPLPIGYRGLDKVGLLEGAVGIALTLLSYSRRERSGWSRAFLLH